jgi:hypothetical protein
MKQSSPPHPDGIAPTDTRTPFQKFQHLTRHILTTPKTELLKPGPKAAKKRKG